ncbi:hypothetical protein MTO96_001886 [Rhipicephalus appendiculatus]
MADCKEKILHYGKRLEKNQSDEKVLETLRKLQKVPMTLNLLQDTGIGRTVNHLKKNTGVIGELARAIISSWKQVVSDSTAEYPEQQQQQPPPPPVSSKRHHEGKQDEPPAKTSRTSKPQATVKGGLDGSIASFEACLGLNDTVPLPKPKKKPQIASPAKKQQPSRVEPAKEATKQHSSKGAESSRSKNGEGGSGGGHSSSGSRSSKHSNKKEQLMPEALRKPDLAPLDRDEVSSMLPEIQPVYKPLPHRLFDEPPSKPPKKTIIFTSSRKDRTQVYSGRRNCFLPEVPTLHEACLKVLMDNIEGMEYTGGVPYDILKPVLERCTPKQLYTLEDYNPYLLNDTDELWQAHCTREFKSSCPDAGETWRELYLKKFDEREEKFKSLTATISASMAKATPVRQTKLAYVDTVAKPPRNVARQQAKHGTGLQAAIPVRPSDRLSSRPMSSPSASASVSRPSAAPPAIPKKPKVAPLMQKTLKFMKQRFKR